MNWRGLATIVIRLSISAFESSPALHDDRNISYHNERTRRCYYQWQNYLLFMSTSAFLQTIFAKRRPIPLIEVIANMIFCFPSTFVFCTRRMCWKSSFATSDCQNHHIRNSEQMKKTMRGKEFGITMVVMQLSFFSYQHLKCNKNVNFKKAVMWCTLQELVKICLYAISLFRAKHANMWINFRSLGLYNH